MFWDYIHTITSKEYVSLIEYKNRAYYKVNIPEEGEKVISINNFDNVIDYYLYTLYPEQYKKCEECKKLIRIKNNRSKYCKECAKKNKILQDRKADKKYKTKLKSEKIENAETH
jgi:hypothetical protein